MVSSSNALEIIQFLRAEACIKRAIIFSVYLVFIIFNKKSPAEGGAGRLSVLRWLRCNSMDKAAMLENFYYILCHIQPKKYNIRYLKGYVLESVNSQLQALL